MAGVGLLTLPIPARKEIDMDYPVDAPEGVAPVIFRAQILQSMALRYKVAASLDDESARDAALATWETDWDSDPLPRTIQGGIDEVDSDLEHWEGD